MSGLPPKQQKPDGGTTFYMNFKPLLCYFNRATPRAVQATPGSWPPRIVFRLREE